MLQIIKILSLLILLLCFGFVIYWFVMDIAKIIFGKDNIIYENNNNEIILTIDDVPHFCDSFNEILNILNKYECKATFFVISSYVTLKNRQLLITAIKNGHHLANHGEYNKMHALCSYDDIVKEINTCQKLLHELYTEAKIKMPKNKYYRPGCGLISSQIKKYCKDEGYKITLGSNYCSDTKCPIFLNETYILCHLKTNDIIIIHDKVNTIELLKRLLKNGLKTVSLENFNE